MKKQNSKKTIYGIITLYDTFFQRILVRTGFLEHIFQRLQFSVSISEEISMIQVWAFPFSLAVTKGILVSFFSSTYLYA